MSKIKVSDLAKELGRESKEIIQFLGEKNIFIEFLLCFITTNRQSC